MREKVKKSQTLNQLANTPRKGLYKVEDDKVTNEFDVLIINKTDDKIYKASKSSLGGIESVVEGTNITIDSTDPANPIISSTGGSGGSQLEASIEAVSRDLTIDDIDKLLVVVADGVILSMPVGDTFTEANNLKPISIICYNTTPNSSGIEINTGSVIYPNVATSGEEGIGAELLELYVITSSGQSSLIPRSTAHIFGGDLSPEPVTALSYLLKCNTRYLETLVEIDYTELNLYAITVGFNKAFDASIPAGRAIEKIIIVYDTAFASPIDNNFGFSYLESGTLHGIADGDYFVFDATFLQHNLYGAIITAIGGAASTVPVDLNYGFQTSQLNTSGSVNFEFEADGGINPQDYTAGHITIYAITTEIAKQLP